MVDFSLLIYRLALQLRAPETLSSLSKSRIFLFNVHLALFVRRMAKLWSQNHIGKLALQSPLADKTASRIAAELGKNCGAPLEKRFTISCYRDDVKKE